MQPAPRSRTRRALRPQVSTSTIIKARLTYGQTVLGLVGASPDAILAEKNAVILYTSAALRAKGVGLSASKATSKAIIDAAKAGNKKEANDLLVKLVADTKLSKYESCGIISGSKFVDAPGVACQGDSNFGAIGFLPKDRLKDSVSAQASK